MKNTSNFNEFGPLDIMTYALFPLTFYSSIEPLDEDFFGHFAFAQGNPQI